MSVSASKRWNYISEANPETVHGLTQALFVAPEIAALLVQRGIDTPEAAAAFFHPDLRQLPNPLLMRDMPRAVGRLAHALHEGEKVMVLGDYDVDGITSVATVISYLTPLFGAARLRDYIPDRYTEGYGISEKAIDFAADNGFALIVALDCGIKAVARWRMPAAGASISLFATTTCPATSCRPPWPCSTPSGPTASTPTRSFRAAAWASS